MGHFVIVCRVGITDGYRSLPGLVSSISFRHGEIAPRARSGPVPIRPIVMVL